MERQHSLRSASTRVESARRAPRRHPLAPSFAFDVNKLVSTASLPQIKLDSAHEKADIAWRNGSDDVRGESRARRRSHADRTGRNALPDRSAEARFREEDRA